MESVVFTFGLGKSIVNELKCKFATMWLLNPQSLVQPSIGGHHLWYAVYRVFAALYLITTFMYVVILICLDERPRLLMMHYPMVGYIVSIIGAVLHAYATFVDYRHGSQPTDVAIKSVRRLKGFRRRRYLKMSARSRRLRILYIVIWLAFNIQLFWGLFTLILYEFSLFKGALPHVMPSPKGVEPDEIILHVAYFAYTFVDFWISGIPVRLLHFYMVIAFDIFYKLVSIGIYLAIFREYIGRPMYDVLVLQADRVPICVLLYVGFTIIMPIAVHIVYFYLFLIRSHFVSWLLVTDPSDAQKQQQEQQQDPLDHETLSAELVVPAAMDDGKTSGTSRSGLLPPGMMTITEIEESELENVSVQDVSRSALHQSV